MQKPPSNIQREIDVTFTSAYQSLQKANIQMGIHEVEALSFSVPVENSISIKRRSVMGTEIPKVEYDAGELKPSYPFYGTKMSLDEACEKFQKVKELTIRLAQVETSAYRLAYNIKKTQKRANALQNITIPVARVVLPTPGISFKSIWPPARMAATAFTIQSSLPITAFFTSWITANAGICCLYASISFDLFILYHRFFIRLITFSRVNSSLSFSSSALCMLLVNDSYLGMVIFCRALAFRVWAKPPWQRHCPNPCPCSRTGYSLPRMCCPRI